MLHLTKEAPEVASGFGRYMLALMRATNREITEFSDSCLIAAQVSMQGARDNPLDMMQALEVLQHNQALMTKGVLSAQEKMMDYVFDQVEEGMQATFNTLFNVEGEKISGYINREAGVMESVANFNEQINKIKDEFGFHFNSGNYKLVHETDTFQMYQVLPLKAGVKVRDDVKPMLLVPPYMLGVHILSFLPYENKSYAHSFANEGVPTYVRVVKDIMTDAKVQQTTPDSDCLQTVELCKKLMEIHGKKAVLNGTCQGGYICLMNLLSGKFDGIVDTLITNVAPIDGTYSDAISGMPQMHHDFISTTLPSGNKVANGYLLSLGMRFVAIDRETPLVKVLDQASLHKATDLNPGKTPAALFRWLLKERTHLPLEIAKMSSCTFQQPIGADGTLPVQLFGQPLNLKKLADLKVKWYQNYAIKDDLVTPPCATAGNRFLEGTDVVESVAFHGGHVAILTSPYAKKAPVNGTFTDATGKKVRGPVKFMIDMAS
ncbi:Poly(R)-hydroxyalkanoic acid synthase, class III, PhaC subunit [uncultured Defluviicoccus sp.]|uniref:Poly(R)-hydroxyalkanoic acid synthase, class III, PhaC subunit n=1 Tax=metagenome TaxID=256318 RepID=A0A380TEH8_9ZZZZ|nr:Poly(R)-hydroxyalkanoic acid synthase, class III, PhaC subunit [uncultured Defluviicoccus sp.]